MTVSHPSLQMRCRNFSAMLRTSPRLTRELWASIITPFRTPRENLVKGPPAKILGLAVLKAPSTTNRPS